MVVSERQQVLIDGGSGLNLIFASTLAKMGLNYMSLLTPSKAPFYGIVPGNSSTPIGSVTLQSHSVQNRTFGQNTSNSK